MSTHTDKYQIIEHNGKPTFVLVPVDDFRELKDKASLNTQKTGIPHAVVEAHVFNDVSIIKAWREYRGLTQQELADAAGMEQSAIARIEKKGAATPRRATLQKLGSAMGLTLEQLDID
ncbi:MAG: helix-turn-helix transcriptional regulator [Sedimenticola sp.]